VAGKSPVGTLGEPAAYPYDISGRGVDLIDQLAACWGFTRRRAAETRVWFELSADSDSDWGG
jgi:hypothetical protein